MFWSQGHQLADIGTRIQGLQQSLDSDLAMLGKNPENLPPDELANAQAKLRDKVNEQFQQLLQASEAVKVQLQQETEHFKSIYNNLTSVIDQEAHRSQQEFVEAVGNIERIVISFTDAASMPSTRSCRPFMNFGELLVRVRVCSGSQGPQVPAPCLLKQQGRPASALLVMHIRHMSV